MTTNGLAEDWNNPRSLQRSKRAILIGIQSADFIKASGYRAAKTGRTYGSNRPITSDRQKDLACGGHPHKDTTAAFRTYRFENLSTDIIGSVRCIMRWQ